MARFVLEKLPETEDELYWTVRALWGVIIPRTRVCPDHVSPFDAFADAYFNRDGTISLWHGSRGLSGKSFTLSILGLTKAFLLGSDVNVLGGSLAQSANIHETMRLALDNDNAPREMMTRESQQLIRLTNKARIRPLTASQKTVRGPHPPFLLLDEIDEMDLPILDAALGQPLPQKNYLDQIIQPYTVLCSTWQNPDGTFTEIKRRFEERGLPMKTWCYRESMNPVDGWLSPETVEAKKREIPNEMWRVEYELGEPSIANRAFDTDAVESTFQDIEPIEVKESKDYEEYKFAYYNRDARYVISADWAKEQDYTVISVMRVDKKPYTLVHWLRVNRRPWPWMLDQFNKLMLEYSAIGIHDGTGIGGVVNDYIDDRAHKFQMIGAKRSNMLTEYVAAFEQGEFIFPKFNSNYLAHKYARVGDLYSTTMDYHLPDEVCSLALAYHHAKKMGWLGGGEVLIKDQEPNKYERVFEAHKHERRDGEVRVVSDPNELTLLV